MVNSMAFCCACMYRGTTKCSYTPFFICPHNFYSKGLFLYKKAGTLPIEYFVLCFISLSLCFKYLF